MKQYAVNAPNEEKNKKRGLVITLWFHVGLLCLAFFPLMGAIQDIQLEENIVEFVSMDDIEIQEDEVKFVENVEDQSRKNASTEESQTKELAPTPEPTPAPAPTPDPKPVETVPDPEVPAVATSDNQQAEAVKTVEAPPVITPAPEPTPTPSKPSGTTVSDKNKAGGKADKNTHASGDGGNDDTLQEGVFGRKVMRRPNIKGLTKKKGKIAIKVCVSQEGTVIATKFLSQFSTIYEAKLIAAASRAARYYKFDVDYTAPKKQWGKLTFVFDLD